MQPSDDAPARDWHALDADEVRELWGSSDEGLTAHEVRRRQARFGRNELPAERRRGPVVRFFRQFHNVLLYVMMAAGVVTALLERWVDTAVLFGAVLANVVIAFVQEGKAESALDAIRSMLSPRATVIRDGTRYEVDAVDLVPGDVIVLKAGDRVPADTRLTRVANLRVDEAALTGESVPVDKSTEPVPAEAPVGDRSGMAYSGTLVVQGRARGVVVGTGVNTEIGSINVMLARLPPLATPLLRQIGRIGRFIALVIVVLTVVTYVLGVLWRNHPPEEMFLMAVALAASAIPEGLPAVMTVTLALGVQRMSQRRSIVRRLPAVEALGSVTVICTDKTGTLTRNEMTVQRVLCAGHEFEIGGVGYAPAGDVTLDGRVVDIRRHPALQALARTALLCNDSRLVEDEGVWRVEGDPTDGALLTFGTKIGMRRDKVVQDCPRLSAVPFDSRHGLMATYHRDDAGQPVVLVKGAPEHVLGLCSRVLEHHDERRLDREVWQGKADVTAAQGLRVIALARRVGAPAGDKLTLDDLSAGGFTLLGLVGIIDPPRTEAIEAVAQCHRAGIRVKMITGDHIETAKAIAYQLAIGRNKRALTGAQIAKMDEAELRTAVRDVDVFARASPEHKLRLVRALQADRQVVAMTGDGVNDAPALKRADVGVAMGRKGTEAAKEVADIVLVDDNFATIAGAVAEGRTVYDNIRKFILFMLPTNGGEALVVIAAILFQLTLPLTPAQVLWINLATSGTLGLALAFEPGEGDVMARPPRPPKEALLTRYFAWRVMLVSVLMAAGGLFMFLSELRTGTSVETARTMAVNAIVLAEMFYLLNSRYLYSPSLTWRGLTENKVAVVCVAACILLQLLFTYTGPLQSLFGTTALGYVEWIKAASVGVVVLLVVEAEKAVRRRVSDSQRGGWTPRMSRFSPRRSRSR